jgi:hypothetical protein
MELTRSVGIVPDSTTLEELPEWPDWEFSGEMYGWESYFYPRKNITVTVHKLDINRVVRSIAFSGPSRHVLGNGLVMNQSSLEEVEEVTGHTNMYSHRAEVFGDGAKYNFTEVDGEYVFDSLVISPERKYGRFPNYQRDTCFYDSLSNGLFKLIAGTPYSQKSKSEAINLIFNGSSDYPDSISRWIDEEHFVVSVFYRVYLEVVDLNIVYKQSRLGLLPVYHSLSINRDTSKLIDKSYVLDENLRGRFQDLSDRAIVGFYCSIGGSPPQSMDYLFGLINDREFDKIRSLLYSSSPEWRAHGLIGTIFYRFRYKMDVSDQDRKKMDEIYDSPVKLFFCKGCNFGELKFSDIISYKDFYEYYKSLTITGHIR